MNNTIFFFFYNLAHQSVIGDKLIVFFAHIFPYLVVILAGIFILFHHEVFGAEKPFQAFVQKRREIFLLFFSGIFGWIISNVLKFFFQTQRPFEIFPQINTLLPETDFAFPSNHAAFFMALAFAIFFYHKKAGYLFMFFALLIGLARIMAGVHFPADILGGFVLGALVAYLIKNV